MNQKEKILIVDDEKIVRESLYHWFSDEGYYVNTAEDGETALKIFTNNKYDLVIVDLKMPGMNGLELLKKIKEFDKETVVIIATAFASVSSAIAALKDGAYDYVTKPVDPDELTNLVQKALEQKALKLENKMLKGNIDEIFNPGNIIGETPQIKKILFQISDIAQSNTVVMLTGESGTGKELIAKAIHNNSNRRYFPFISIKCGALPDIILETELLGMEPGTISGSQIKRKGKLELVNGGTLYLDEIGTIPLKVQAEILNVLENKKFTPLGGKEFIDVDFRLIVANKSPLESLCKEGKFLNDLFYKINVFNIDVPTLKDRKEDIGLIANFFINKFSTIMNKPVKRLSKSAYDFLLSYDWPGNVRELENAIERAVVISKSDEIKVEDFPFHTKSSFVDIDENSQSLSAVEKKYILKVLNDNKWNISRSAQILEIDRVTLYNKINKYQLKMYKRQ
jgi:DNA-binding NtrC family response regulator